MQVDLDRPKPFPNKKSTKVQKVHKYKSTHNLAIFWATDSRFCMEVHMDCRIKWQNTKVQKVQNYKSTKLQKIKLKKYKYAKKCKKVKKT